jgi:hypothetical protein
MIAPPLYSITTVANAVERRHAASRLATRKEKSHGKPSLSWQSLGKAEFDVHSALGRASH